MFSFWNFLKINVIMVAAGFVFNPLNAFAITNKVQTIYDVNYAVSGNSADTTPILIMAGILSAVLFAYYRADVRDYKQSLRCKNCGCLKHGVKCLTCKSGR